jgi:hypothetical protein
VKHVRFVVVNELVLECDLDLACSDVALLDDVLKLIGDHTKDPGDDDALHALPSRIVDGRGIVENVVTEVAGLQGEQNLIAPVVVACRRMIYNR